VLLLLLLLLLLHERLVITVRRGRRLRFVFDRLVYRVRSGFIALPIAKYLPVNANTRLAMVGKQYLLTREYKTAFIT